MRCESVFKKLALPLALAGAIALPGAVHAATVEFSFFGGSSFEDAPKTFTESGYSVDVMAMNLTFGANGNLGHYEDGLGVGNVDGNGGGKLGNDESLVFDFGREVTLSSLTLVDWAKPAAGDMTFDMIVDRVNRGNYGVNAPTGGGRTVVDFGTSLTGSVFQVTGTMNDDIIRDGLLIGAATISVAAVPVPPAAPLLGGALGLMWWRARRKSAR